ncbi:MAG TPA: GNAT family N-acetyltransferase [Segetibacter sp.]|jgi:hypothetical protein
MKIQHKEEENSGTFYITENGNGLAEMVYRREKEKIIIEHTYVDEALRGKNIGFELVERSVEFARQEHVKIVATCSFAKKILEQNEQFQDVLPVE